MQPDVKRWLDLAVDHADAVNATAAIARFRGRCAEKLGVPVRSYEVVIQDDENLLAVAERVRPRFSYHMESLGLPREGSPAVFFSVFAGSGLYFLEATTTMALFAEVQDAAHPPLMLPGR